MATQDAAKQVSAALELATTVGYLIRDIGRPIPSGELYSRLMGFMSIHTYTGVIDMLKRAKFIKVESHLITWIGPKGGDSAKPAGNKSEQKGADDSGAGERGDA